MSVTQAQLDELHDGDVVELTKSSRVHGATHVGDTFRGPVRKSTGGSWVFGVSVLRWSDGALGGWTDNYDLKIVERAPVPFYANHSRVEPVVGDVVRNAWDPDDTQVWMYDGPRAYRTTDVWWNASANRRGSRNEMPDTLRLLVDGATGQVVVP